MMTMYNHLEQNVQHDRVVVLNVGLDLGYAADDRVTQQDIAFCTAPLISDMTPNYFERTLSTAIEVSQAQCGLPELTGLTPHSKLLIVADSEGRSEAPVNMEIVAEIIATSLGKRKNRFTEQAPLSITLFHCVGGKMYDNQDSYQLAHQLVSELAERHIMAKLDAPVPMHILPMAVTKIESEFESHVMLHS